MSIKPDEQNPLLASLVEEFKAERDETPAPKKKPFVEPEVSFPVDVLEATTFFMQTDSGGF